MIDHEYEVKKDFLLKWEKYFGNAELPLVWFYSDSTCGTEMVPPSRKWSCIICELSKARNGTGMCFNSDSLGCGGAKRFLGFATEIRPNFEYFLSCGIPGEMEGERYIRTPEMVQEIISNQKKLPAEEKKYFFQEMGQPF